MTIAVPTLAADEALVECLKALALQTYRDFQVVVVDNSGKRLVNRLAAVARPGVRVLEMARNVGFGAAINAAWAGCGSPYLATLNDDAVPCPEWLAALIQAAERHAESGMFASCVRLAGGRVLDSAGMVLCADGSSKQRGHGQAERQFDCEAEVLLPSGSAALYRAAMIERIGAFDDHFFLYCEDTDLGLRGRRAGWSCTYVPDAKVEHRYSHSAGRVSALKAYYVERNRLFLLLKNFPIRMLLSAAIVAPLRYIWHVIYAMQGRGAAAQFASEGGSGWRLPWFVLKAHIAAFDALPRLLRQRRSIRATARLTDAEFGRLLRGYSIPVRKIAQY